MHVYDGEVVQVSDPFFMGALLSYGLAIYGPETHQSFDVGKEYGVQYRSEPKKLVLVRVMAVQFDQTNEKYSYVIMRRGTFFKPDEIKAVFAHMFAEEALSEINI